MKSLASIAGRKRALVEYVSPSLNGRSGAIKRLEGTPLHIRAHMFADGHDVVVAEFRWRKFGETSWQRVRMHPHPNDEFSFSWLPPEIGLYEYHVVGWTDAFVSWSEGFAKKAEAGQALDVELVIGARLIAEGAKRASGKDAKLLEAWSASLGDSDRGLKERVQLARSGSLAAKMSEYPDPELVVEGTENRLLVERERGLFSTWYEYFPRSCSDNADRHGTFSDAAAHLPEVAAMGFDVVYFPPIHPIGRAFRKGRNNSLTAGPGDVGSPWAIGAAEGGHKAIHPELGTLDDFRAFCKAAAGYGVEVALDIAFQCSPDHPYLKDHPQWFRWRPDGTVQYAENPPKKYQDILPFDFECDDWKALWLELKSVFTYWIGQGVKIFRVDNPHTKSFPFWSWCLTELKREHPDALFLAEAFTRPKRKYWLGRAGFTQGYTYFTWRNDARAMREYVEELTQTEVADYFWPNFWPNTPDILHEDLQQGTRATFIGRYVLAATLSSNVGIYGPAYEVMDRDPFPGREEYNNNEKYQLKHWDRHVQGNITEEISRVNWIRRENAALRQFRNIQFIDSDNPQLLAYLKWSDDQRNRILTVVNMDWNWTQMGHVMIPVDELGFGSDQEFGVEDLMDPLKPIYRWKRVKNFIRLDPKQASAHIFRLVD